MKTGNPHSKLQNSHDTTYNIGNVHGQHVARVSAGIHMPSGTAEFAEVPVFDSSSSSQQMEFSRMERAIIEPGDGMAQNIQNIDVHKPTMNTQIRVDSEEKSERLSHHEVSSKKTSDQRHNHIGSSDSLQCGMRDVKPPVQKKMFPQDFEEKEPEDLSSRNVESNLQLKENIKRTGSQRNHDSNNDSFAQERSDMEVTHPNTVDTFASTILRSTATTDHCSSSPIFDSSTAARINTSDGMALLEFAAAAAAPPAPPPVPAPEPPRRSPHHDCSWTSQQAPIWGTISSHRAPVYAGQSMYAMMASENDQHSQLFHGINSPGRRVDNERTRPHQELSAANKTNGDSPLVFSQSNKEFLAHSNGLQHVVDLEKHFANNVKDNNSSVDMQKMQQRQFAKGANTTTLHNYSEQDTALPVPNHGFNINLFDGNYYQQQQHQQQPQQRQDRQQQVALQHLNNFSQLSSFPHLPSNSLYPRQPTVPACLFTSPWFNAATMSPAAGSLAGATNHPFQNISVLYGTPGQSSNVTTTQSLLSPVAASTSGSFLAENLCNPPSFLNFSEGQQIILQNRAGTDTPEPTTNRNVSNIRTTEFDKTSFQRQPSRTTTPSLSDKEKNTFASQTPMDKRITVNSNMNIQTDPPTIVSAPSQNQAQDQRQLQQPFDKRLQSLPHQYLPQASSALQQEHPSAAILLEQQISQTVGNMLHGIPLAAYHPAMQNSFMQTIQQHQQYQHPQHQQLLLCPPSRCMNSVGEYPSTLLHPSQQKQQHLDHTTLLSDIQKVHSEAALFAFSQSPALVSHGVIRDHASPSGPIRRKLASTQAHPGSEAQTNSLHQPFLDPSLQQQFNLTFQPQTKRQQRQQRQLQTETQVTSRAATVRVSRQAKMPSKGQEVGVRRIHNLEWIKKWVDSIENPDVDGYTWEDKNRERSLLHIDTIPETECSASPPWTSAAGTRGRQGRGRGRGGNNRRALQAMTEDSERLRKNIESLQTEREKLEIAWRSRLDLFLKGDHPLSKKIRAKQAQQQQQKRRKPKRHQSFEQQVLPTANMTMESVASSQPITSPRVSAQPLKRTRTTPKRRVPLSSGRRSNRVTNTSRVRESALTQAQTTKDGSRDNPHSKVAKTT